MTSIDLYNLIEEFDNENLVRFIEWKNQNFRPIKEEIDEIEVEGFKEVQKLGEIEFSTSEALILCSIKVTKGLTERSGKKAQFDLAKKVLKYYDDAFDGIFVFYDEAGNFRFSLIYANYFGNRRSFSNYRRFTYFVSRDLSNNTFRNRMETGDFSTLEGIKEAFSVEKVTKVFYEEISNWYFWACQLSKFPPAAEREENGRQVAVIRLITRLIFVWFMREKGLIPADLFNKKAIAECLVNLDDDKSSYYLAILQNLFFATLNTPQQERKFRAETRGPSGHNPDYGNQYVYRHQSMFSQPIQLEEYFKNIPFLNGGLFECLDNKETGDYFDGFTDIIKNQPIFPNVLFFSPEITADLNAELGTNNKHYKVKGLLETLSSYNFTIDENTTDDKDVALDPELLGQVFENLLASFNPETSTTARKGTGSYYTPREIVDYMVDESLKAYLCQYLEDIPDIDQKLTWLLSQEHDSNPFTKKEGSRIVKLVEEVRIVDPAVGSGAFPMGALNKLVLILSKLDPDGNLWEQAQLDAAQLIPDSQIRVDVSEQIRKSFLEKNHDYGRKLYLIQKCIYGVDFQQIAVEITKLRFFISLLVDETVESDKENWGIEPLPNLDFKIMQGNSLISTFEGIDLGPKVKDIPQQDELFSGQGEKAKLIANLQNLKEQYQTISDHRRKQELQKEIDQYFLEIFKINALEQHQDYVTRLAAIDRKYQDVPDPKTREKLKAKEKEKVSSEMGIDINATGLGLNSYSTKQMKRDFFPWKLYFAEVFAEKGGFDIVLGNPPYIEHKKLRHISSVLKDNFQVYSGTGDLYIYFYELGISLLKKGGTLVLITSNKFIKTKYGEGIRGYLANYRIDAIIDFSKVHVFDALVSSSIVIVSVTEGLENKTKITHANNDLISFSNITDFVRSNNYQIDQGSLSSEIWQLEEDGFELKSKIESGSQRINELGSINIYRGLTTGFNEAFIISEEIKRDLINRDQNNIAIIKPLLQGRNIRKWYYETSNKYLLQTGYDDNIKVDYPLIFDHLQNYQKALESRADKGKNWWNLRACKYNSEFEKEKIIWGLTSDKWAFAIDDKKHFLPSNGYILTSKKLSIKYLLSLINSKLMEFYFGYVGIMTAGGAFTLKFDSISLLPIKVLSIEEQQPFIDHVEKILEITQRKIYKNDKSQQLIVDKLEMELDNQVYSLYGLSKSDIEFIENKINS